MTLFLDIDEGLSSSNWHLKMEVIEREKRDYPEKKNPLSAKKRKNVQQTRCTYGVQRRQD